MPEVFNAAVKKQKPQDKSVKTATAVLNKNPVTMFTTYCLNPKDIELKGQDSDEQILLFLRRDFITNFPWIFNTIFFAILPFLLKPLFTIANISFDFLPADLSLMTSVFYYLLLFGYALANFLTWFYTIGVVTNKKAVDIDFHDFSSIHVSTVNLVDSSNVKYIQQGFFQSFFDYGDIIVTIEATSIQFIFEQTPRPAEVTDFLSDLIGGS